MQKIRFAACAAAIEPPFFFDRLLELGKYDLIGYKQRKKKKMVRSTAYFTIFECSYETRAYRYVCIYILLSGAVVHQHFPEYLNTLERVAQFTS